MQTLNTTDHRTSRILVWLAFSPLGLVGLPRYLYQGNIGMIKTIFFYYFLVILVCKIGILHMVGQLAPSWTANFSVASNWMLGLVMFMHLGIYLDELRFFKSIGPGQKLPNGN
jgi:hypothetical protein